MIKKNPSSLRCREINDKYGIDAVGWTYLLASGKNGEWWYSQEELRFHGWSTNGIIKKIMVINSNKDIRDKIHKNGDYSLKQNSENGQWFIMITIDILRKYNLIIEEIDF